MDGRLLVLIFTKTYHSISYIFFHDQFYIYNRLKRNFYIRMEYVLPLRIVERDVFVKP